MVQDNLKPNRLFVKKINHGIVHLSDDELSAQDKNTITYKSSMH